MTAGTFYVQAKNNTALACSERCADHVGELLRAEAVQLQECLLGNCQQKHCPWLMPQHCIPAAIMHHCQLADCKALGPNEPIFIYNRVYSAGAMHLLMKVVTQVFEQQASESVWMSINDILSFPG